MYCKGMCLIKLTSTTSVRLIRDLCLFACFGTFYYEHDLISSYIIY
jgi:hypothetical protein